MSRALMTFLNAEGVEVPVSSSNTLPTSGGGGGGGGGGGDASAANQVTGNATLASIDGHVDGLEALIGTTNTEVGATNETAPATDIAASGLNGRLQRIAQRITSLIALLPASLGAKTGANSLSVVPNSDTAFPVTAAALPLPAGAATSAKQDTLQTATGSVSDVAWASGDGSHTALLKTIAVAAQDTSPSAITAASLPLPTGASTEATLASQSAKLPSSLGAKTGALSFSVVPNTDTAFPSSQSGAWNITNISGTISLPTGAATETTLAAQSAKLPASLGGKTGAASLSVVPASDGFTVTAAGTVAASTTDSGNPLKIGGFGSSSIPTAATTGQRVNAWYGLNGQAATSIVDLSTGNATACPQFNADGNVSQRGLSIWGFGLVYNNTAWDRIRGDIGGLVVQPYAMAGSRWSYAAASGGIVNTTTAVTIVAAAGVGIRNYCNSLQLSSDTLGAATEIAIRDGAAGTVLWRQKLQTTSLPLQTIKFDPPLRGTANTLMEFVTLTASVTGAVYVDAQGHTSAV